MDFCQCFTSHAKPDVYVTPCCCCLFGTSGGFLLVRERRVQLLNFACVHGLSNMYVSRYR